MFSTTCDLLMHAIICLSHFDQICRHKHRMPTRGHGRGDTMPVTTRQLEASIRLSQARAKACLRDFVLKEDALDVVEILRRSVEQVYTDEHGVVDRARGGAGGMSNRKMRRAFGEELRKVVGIGASCTVDDLRRVADRLRFPLDGFNTMIEDMRDNCLLARKADGTFEVMA